MAYMISNLLIKISLINHACHAPALVFVLCILHLIYLGVLCCYSLVPFSYSFFFLSIFDLFFHLFSITGIFSYSKTALMSSCVVFHLSCTVYLYKFKCVLNIGVIPNNWLALSLWNHHTLFRP